MGVGEGGRGGFGYRGGRGERRADLRILERDDLARRCAREDDACSHSWTCEEAPLSHRAPLRARGRCLRRRPQRAGSPPRAAAAQSSAPRASRTCAALSLGEPRSPLGALSGPLGPSRAISGHLEAISGHLGAISGHLWSSRVISSHLESSRLAPAEQLQERLPEDVGVVVHVHVPVHSQRCEETPFTPAPWSPVFGERTTRSPAAPPSARARRTRRWPSS